MARASEQVEWLDLIDRSGPFVVPALLEEVFPQGLEKVETPHRQRVRAAYDEWRDAVDEGDPQIGELHAEWTRLVIQETLEYENEVLVPRERLAGRIAYRAPEDGAEAAPDFAVCGEDGRPRLLIAILPPETDLEKPLPSDRWPASPAERMTLLCRATGVRVGLVTNGEHWMLVNAPIGSTAGYASWLARLWWQEPLTLRAFVSLLGVRRCFGPPEDSIDQLLERSVASQEEVTDTLGEQVRRAVEVLIQALGRADDDRNGQLLSDVRPRELYEAGLTVMMRLVFILCAEERGLLLLGDPIYDQHYAISTLRAGLREDEDRHGPEVLERRYDAWSRMLAVFRAVYGGVEHEAMRMPALGGSLFDPDRFPFLEGRAKGTSWKEEPAAPLPIDNRTVLLLLTALQVLEQRGGAQRLSYRALDIEQIGHVYEGLLEYTVAKVGEVTLGLIGSQKVRHPSIGVGELEALLAQGADVAAERLADITGRSPAAVRNALVSTPDNANVLKLIHACAGDEALAQRIGPFAGLVRTDAWGSLLVYRTGSFALARGADRRETGTHYTPRSLTEIIVEKTLEPLLYDGPAQGKPREKWVLKKPAELLDLKICDPAMGSGAFLVQACRYLAERLVEAWIHEEDAGRTVSYDGLVRNGVDDREPLPKDMDDRLAVARRLVAERCLYGVDLNPLAVELAKLSIWLVTLAKGRPFGFLDHNLRCGDSLLGIYRLSQLIDLDMTLESGPHQRRLFGQSIEAAVHETIKLRQRLREVPIRDIQDVQAMARLDTEARHVVEKPLLFADALVAAVLRSNGSNNALAASVGMLAMQADRIATSDEAAENELKHWVEESLSADLPEGKYTKEPFHWALQFPEVFARDDHGFDSLVGNPPFLGNRLWKPTLGGLMQLQAQMILRAPPGKVDLCLLFHRRAVDLVKSGGTYGLLATSNIAEGSAVNVGLGKIVTMGDIIYSRKKFPWPGKAAVDVAIICFYKGRYSGVKMAEGEPCHNIGPRLEPDRAILWEPRVLHQAMFSFEGVHNGQGLAFVIGDDHPWFAPLRAEPGSLLRPYVTGDDITTHSLTSIRRWALDIGDRSLETIAASYPAAYRFLLEVVKPTRAPDTLESYKGLIDRWWQFWNHRADLVRRLRKQQNCIAYPKLTKHPIGLLAPSDWIYTNQVVLIGFERPDLLAICLSSPFRHWIESFSGARFGTRLRLSIRETLNTFPLPQRGVSDRGVDAASRFNELAVAWSRANGCGMTKVMNAIHRPDTSDTMIAAMRGCLEQIDTEVLQAYGWDYQDTKYGFRELRTLPENDRWRCCIAEPVQLELIQRLLELNRERYEMENR